MGKLNTLHMMSQLVGLPPFLLRLLELLQILGSVLASVCPKLVLLNTTFAVELYDVENAMYIRRLSSSPWTSSAFNIPESYVKKPTQQS